MKNIKRILALSIAYLILLCIESNPEHFFFNPISWSMPGKIFFAFPVTIVGSLLIFDFKGSKVKDFIDKALSEEEG